MPLVMRKSNAPRRCRYSTPGKSTGCTWAVITLNSHAQNDRQGTHRLRILRLRKTLYCRAQPEKNILTGIVELTEIDERVRMLCAKAAHARESEAEEILAELRQALK